MVNRQQGRYVKALFLQNSGRTLFLIVLALLAHVLIPRYEFQQTSGTRVWVKIDRWMGTAEGMYVEP